MHTALARVLLLLLLSEILAGSASAAAFLRRFTPSDRTTVSAVAVDRGGNTVVCGTTERPDVFPRVVRLGTVSKRDAFVLKLDSRGAVRSAVVFGGSEDDQASKLAVDGDGNIVVAGTTASVDFPGLRGPAPGFGVRRTFVAQLDASGTNLTTVRLLGGSSYEMPMALAVDGEGRVCVAGQTLSPIFPQGSSIRANEGNAVRDYVAGVNSDPDAVEPLRFLIDLGKGFSQDSVHSMAADAVGNIYVTGRSASLEFPTTNAWQELLPVFNQARAFLTKIAPAGEVVYSTPLAGDFEDSGDAVALSPDGGTVWVAGVTRSGEFPSGLWPGVGGDGRARGFLLELDSATGSVARTNFFGATLNARMAGMLVLGNRRVLVAATANGLSGSARGMVPIFLALGSAGEQSLLLDPLHAGSNADFGGLASAGAGEVVTYGAEWGYGQAGSTFVARYSLIEMDQGIPLVRMVSPVPETRHVPGQDVGLQALVAGTSTDTVRSVTFKAGRRVLGVVTNPVSSASFVWADVPRGVYSVSAVAEVNGRSVTSRPVQVTVASPRNDDFARRTRLTGAAFDVAGRTEAATSEPGEGTDDGRSVWYSWVAPSDDVFELQLSPDDPTAWWVTGTLTEGDELIGSFPFVSIYANYPVTVRAKRGAVYSIRVWSYPSVTGDDGFRLRLKSVVPPVNDDFARAITIAGETVEVRSRVDHATSEAGESGYSGAVWYSWTAPTSGSYLAAVAPGASSAGTLVVYTGAAISNLQAVGFALLGTTNGWSFTAEAGVVYRIAVSGSGVDEVAWRLSRITPPVNDLFAQRLAIPAGINAATGTMAGATWEAEEVSSGRYHAPSVWWTWRPMTAGVYRVSVRPILRANVGGVGLNTPAFGNMLDVLVGNDLPSLQSVVPNDSSGLVEVSFQASPETNYVIVNRYPYSLFALDITPVLVPENDDFANARRIAGAFVALPVSVAGASTEPDEPLTGPFPTGSNRSIWYRWTAPTNGDYVVTIAGGGVAAYIGDSLEGLEAVGALSTRLELRSTAGQEFRLRVVGPDAYELRIRPAVRPPNDDFSQREVLTGLPVQFTPIGFEASNEPGEPGGGSSYLGSIWYTWTAPLSGNCLIAAFSVNGVFTGDSLTNLTAVNGGPAPGGWEFLAIAGTTYQVSLALGSFPGSPPASRRMIELRMQTPPPNDGFATRASLVGSSAEVAGSNVGATRELGEPPVGPLASGRTVWWTWRAPSEGVATFSASSAEVGSLAGAFNGSLAVFTGASLDELRAVSDTNFWQGGYPFAALHVPVSAGREYHVAVDTPNSGSSGPFRLSVALRPQARNDNFVDRRAWTGEAEGTFHSASMEEGESQPMWPTPGTLWWSWTPRTGGIYEFNVETESFSGRPTAETVGVDLYLGDTLSELGSMAHVVEPGHITFRFLAEAGYRYALRLAGTADRYKFRMAYRPPPDNDAFARRTVLRGASVTVTGSNATATTEVNEPDVDSEIHQSAWWSWTAPGAGSVRITVDHPACQLIRVYTGTQLDALTEVAEGDSQTAVARVEAGRAYQIAVKPKECGSTSHEPFSLSLIYDRPPANDNFANRQALSGATVLVTNATILGAGPEEGEPRVTGGSGATVWWKWIAPATGRYTFESEFGFALYTGTQRTNLTLVGASPGSISAVNVAVTAGTELVWLVDGALEGAPERFALRIRPTAVPVNDAFAHRSEVGGNRLFGNLEGSTFEVGEPGGLLDPFGTSLWWTLTPTNDGWHELVLTTPTVAPSVRATLAVYRGTDLDHLEWIFPRPNRRSFGEFRRHYLLEAGVPYAIRVVGLDHWFGPVELGIRFVQKTPIDHFTNAAHYAASGVTLSGSNTLCTVELFEPGHYQESFPNSLVNSIWWRWTAAAAGVYSITRSNSPAFAYVDVYTGNSISNLARVSSTVYGRDLGEYLFRADAGVTYAIAATTVSEQEGQIQLRLQPANPPSNDDFVGRAVLTGAHVSITATNYDATAEIGDPVADVIGQQTVWWRWTAPASGNVTINVNGSYRGGVFRGDDLESLTTVLAPGRSFPQWPATFSAEAGVEYSIGVTPWSEFARPFVLTLDQSELTLLAPASAREWVIETSTNLIDWVPMATNQVGVAGFTVEPNRSERTRFYRNRPTGE